MKKRYAVMGVLILGVWAVGIGNTFAEDQSAAGGRRLVSTEQDEKKVRMEVKTLSGKVSARGPNGLALDYAQNLEKRSSNEMWLPYEGDVKFLGYETKMDVGEGDFVTVTYAEAEDGSKRVLTAVKLERKYEPPVEEDDEESEESSP